MMASNDVDELVIGDFENVKFSRVENLFNVLPGLAKYSLSALIKAKEFDKFLDEYKAEMKRRKVVFPGYRPGKLPLYVMPDVRKYLVCKLSYHLLSLGSDHSP